MPLHSAHHHSAPASDAAAAAAGGATESSPLLGVPVQPTNVAPSISDAAQGGSSSAGAALVPGAAAASNAPARQLAPDLLRGLLMVLMAIDHTSVLLGAYPHGTAVASEAASTIVTQWSDAEPFILRSLTHLCAPGFSMLMGLGLAYWSASRKVRGTPIREQIRHLCTRAFAIILVNQVTFALLIFNKPRFYVLNAILWALAIDYLLVGFLALLIDHVIEPRLSALLFRSSPDASRSSPDSKPSISAALRAARVIDGALLVLFVVCLWINVWTSDNQGACVEATPKVLDWNTADPFCQFTNPKLWYKLMFGSASCANKGIMSPFPPFGWISFVIGGLLYGRILLRAKWPRPTVASFNAGLAVVFAALFASTRLLSYGNLSTSCLHTADQLRQAAGSNQYLASWRSFLYVTKYPPSPAYGFATLSACFLLLAVFSLPLHRAVSTALLPFGQTPLFFYAAHQLVLQVLAMIIMPTHLAHHMPPWAREGRGIGLGATYYIVYSSLIVSMWFACSAYGRWKARKGPDSIWRFL